MNFICMPNGHAAESDMESIRVGIYDNPPKVFLDDAGRPTGFWPELTREIAAREGMDIEWVHGSWAEGLRRLADNDIDVMVDTGLTEPRRERFTFGNETVHVSWSRIYAARGVEIETIPDLDGKRLGGLAGSFNLEGPGASVKSSIDSRWSPRSCPCAPTRTCSRHWIPVSSTRA